jgi:hypothetical protein
MSMTLWWLSKLFCLFNQYGGRRGSKVDTGLGANLESNDTKLFVSSAVGYSMR